MWALFGLVISQGLAGGQETLPSGKIPGAAIVVLSHDFCTAEVNDAANGETFRPGHLLCDAAEEAVRKSFERVIRMEARPKPEDAEDA